MRHMSAVDTLRRTSRRKPSFLIRLTIIIASFGQAPPGPKDATALTAFSSLFHYFPSRPKFVDVTHKPPRNRLRRRGRKPVQAASGSGCPAPGPLRTTAGSPSQPAHTAPAGRAQDRRTRTASGPTALATCICVGPRPERPTSPAYRGRRAVIRLQRWAFGTNPPRVPADDTPHPALGLADAVTAAAGLGECLVDETFVQLEAITFLNQSPGVAHDLLEHAGVRPDLEPAMHGVLRAELPR